MIKVCFLEMGQTFLKCVHPNRRTSGVMFQFQSAGIVLQAVAVEKDREGMWGLSVQRAGQNSITRLLQFANHVFVKVSFFCTSLSQYMPVRYLLKLGGQSISAVVWCAGEDGHQAPWTSFHRCFHHQLRCESQNRHPGVTERNLGGCRQK